MEKTSESCTHRFPAGLTVLGFAGCGGGQSGSASGSSVPKDTIVVGMAVDPETLDPAVTMDNKDDDYYPLTKTGNTRWWTADHYGGDGAFPGQVWTVSDDGLTWTFTWTGGTQFADGSPGCQGGESFSIERVQK